MGTCWHRAVLTLLLASQACSSAPRAENEPHGEPDVEHGRGLEEAGTPSAPSADGGEPEPADGAVTPTCSGAGLAGDHSLTVTSGGLERTYALHVPEAYDPSTAAMLVLGFHGFGMSGAMMAPMTRLSEVSDERGFLVAYPDGVGRAWGGGTCCPGAAGDDVQFVRDLVAAISEAYCVDAKRVFATGISNGGLFTNRLGCEAADLIAAIAPVSSGIGVTCAPSRPVPHLAFSGTADMLVPLSITELEVEQWRDLNGCAAGPSQVYAQGDATCDEWSGCNQGADVRLCRIEGGGHTWPGGVPVPILGNTSMDIDASREMAAFFEGHGME